MKTLSLVVLAFVLLATACSKKQTHTATNADGQKITLASKGDQVSMETVSKSGEKTSLKASASGVELPADFPKDIPIHPKGVVQVYNIMGQNLQIGILVPVPVAEAITYCETEFKNRGWTSEPAIKMGAGAMIHPKKGERSGMVTLTPQDDKHTYIQMVLPR